MESVEHLPILGACQENARFVKEYLLVSDFDQTLIFNDSGIVLSELLNIPSFQERIAGLSRINLVQQGGELAYLLLHDPEYRRVRKEHLVGVGKRIRLKENIPLLSRLLEDLDGHRFSFYVVSAAPEEVIQSALEGIVPEDHIFGTRFHYDSLGEIQSIIRVPAGYGKVAVLEELRAKFGVGHDRVIYVGDGSSDVHVMLHVKIAGWDATKIRALFASHGFVIQEWDKVRTDSLTIAKTAAIAAPAVPS